MRKKGDNNGDNFGKYVKCYIVDDEFEYNSVKFVKSCRPRPDTRGVP